MQRAEPDVLEQGGHDDPDDLLEFGAGRERRLGLDGRGESREGDEAGAGEDRISTKRSRAEQDAPVARLVVILLLLLFVARRAVPRRAIAMPAPLAVPAHPIRARHPRQFPEHAHVGLPDRVGTEDSRLRIGLERCEERSGPEGHFEVDVACGEGVARASVSRRGGGGAGQIGRDGRVEPGVDDADDGPRKEGEVRAALCHKRPGDGQRDEEVSAGRLLS